jgi:hypothetical protein
VRITEKTEKTSTDAKPIMQDQVTISSEGNRALEATVTESDNITGEKKDFIHQLADMLKQSDEDVSAEDEEEGQETSGSVAINAGKLARRLAAAKTKAQVQAIIAEIQQNLSECEAGKAQGLAVDESSVQSAQNLLNQAKQRMGTADSREATPGEEMAFSMSDLM